MGNGYFIAATGDQRFRNIILFLLLSCFTTILHLKVLELSVLLKFRPQFRKTNVYDIGLFVKKCFMKVPDALF